jgi:hypothetical protein
MTIEELRSRLEKNLTEVLVHEVKLPEGIRPHVKIDAKLTIDGESLVWNPRSGDAIVIGFDLEDMINLRRSTPISFNPVPIRGEPISETVIRDRGER